MEYFNRRKHLWVFFCVVVLFGANWLHAQSAATDTQKEVVITQPAKPWGVTLASGFDSLYIFRGVNVIPGSPLYWVQPTLTYNFTKQDSLSIGAWYAVGLHQSAYQELDIVTSYTHTIGNWALSAGYIFYYVPVTDGAYPFYSNEVNAGVSYTFDFKWIKIRPNTFYYFNIGPNFQHNGYSPNAASYLQNRVDFSIPVYKDIIELDPWVALNFNFRYNAQQDGHYFNGINNFEYGVRVPIKVTNWMTVSGYVASTNQWNHLVNTASSLIYFGGQVSLTY
ncbi:MAG: hypothetical protein ABI443_14315 [Chthoniobacterales bacterium]